MFKVGDVVKLNLDILKAKGRGLDLKDHDRVYIISKKDAGYSLSSITDDQGKAWFDDNELILIEKNYVDRTDIVIKE